MKLLALGFLVIAAVALVGTDPSRAVPANGCKGWVSQGLNPSYQLWPPARR